MYFAIGVEPDERHGLDAGVMEDRVDGVLVAVDDVEDALGQASVLEQLRHQDAGRRILFRRLQDERVPAEERNGNIHIGTIAGKLNGVMPAQTPTGSSRE